MTPARLLSLSILFALLVATPCLAQRYIETQSYMASGQAGPFLVDDFDGDGTDELVAISSFGGITAFRWRQNRWQADYVTQMSSTILRTLPVVWETSEGKKVLVLSGHRLPGYDSSLYFLEGWPLRQSRTMRLPSGATAARIADPDLDGNDDLLVLTAGLLFGLDPVTGEERWQLPYGGDDLEVTQLDSDLPLEIAIFGGHSRIVDGLSHATEGFQGSQILSHLLISPPNSSSAHWIGSSPGFGVRSFGASNLTPLNERLDIDPIYLLSGDVEGDGTGEVITADINNEVHVIVPETLEDKWRYNIASNHLTSIQSGNFRGVGADELIFAGAWGLELINGTNGRSVASSHWGGSAIDALAVADIDADGSPELVTATASGKSLTKAIDLASAELNWRYPAEQSLPSYGYNADSMQVGQLDADPALEIVLTGSGSNGFRVLDGGFGSVQFEVRGAELDSPLFGVTPGHTKLLDIVGDDQKEIVFCTSDQLMNRESVRVQALSAADGSEVWRSHGVGSIYAACSGLEYFPATSTHSALFVMLSRGSLYGIDASSGDVMWEQPASAISATKLETAQSTGILVYLKSSSEIVHFDPYTREELLRYSATAEAMAAVPGQDQYWLLYGDQLSLRDRNGGLLEVLPIRQRVEGSTSNPYAGAPVMVANADHGKTWLSISISGVVITFDFDTDRILRQGFE